LLLLLVISLQYIMFFFYCWSFVASYCFLLLVISLQYIIGFFIVGYWLTFIFLLLVISLQYIVVFLLLVIG